MTERFEFLYRDNVLVAIGLLLAVGLFMVRILRRSNQPSIPSLIIRLMYRWSRWCLVVTDCTDLFLKVYRDRISRPLPKPINESGILREYHTSTVNELGLLRDQT